jgi:hypothetical protein
VESWHTIHFKRVN